ncbi:MAG: hypothetical protein ACRDZY_22950, partial [Acidimicrobiales bacterium]
MFTRALRAVLGAALVAGGLWTVAAPAAGAAPAPAVQTGCPVLILGAMPLEADPILAHGYVAPKPVYTFNGRGFWSGTVEGNRAIIAPTGIGMTNATQTTEAAFAHFGCFSALVFSGVSGGDYIGDVMVPTRWTQDGNHFLATSGSTLAVLGQALHQPVPLEQTTPSGDPLCSCQTTGFGGVSTPVTVEHTPAVEVGGTGLSKDGFGGRAFPCVPAGSDVFGCWPCRFADTQTAAQTSNLTTSAPPFLQASFILGYGSNSAAPPGTYASQD